MVAGCRSSARCLCSKRNTRASPTIFLQAPPCGNERFAFVVGRQRQCMIEPADGVIVPTICGKNARIVECTAKIVALGGAAIPFERLGCVALRAPAFLATAP